LLAQGQPVNEVPPHAFHVPRRDPLDGGHAVLGQHRPRAALVTLALLAPHQVARLHAGDLVG
jgi:hypothetical protein